MIPSVMDLLFGCTHRRVGFPITPNPTKKRSAAASVTGTYVVCLECGQEFPYDWEKMRVVPLHSPDARVSAMDELERRAA